MALFTCDTQMWYEELLVNRITGLGRFFVVYCQVLAVPSYHLQQGNCSVGTLQVNYKGPHHHEEPKPDPTAGDSLTA